MTEHNNADEARKGLIDSVKGKAKEIAGALTGNDSLTTEGQLEQSQANERKEADRIEAVADADAAQARAEATAARVEGAQQRTALNAQTAAAKTSIRNQQAAERRAAGQAGQQQATVEKTRAELDALAKMQRAEAKERNEIDFAAGEVSDSVEGHLTTVHAVSTAKLEADRIRRQADILTNKADLP